MINKKLSTINYTDASRKKGDIKYIVIHWVGAVSTALNNAIYFQNQYIGASAHFFCDKTSIWQVVLEEDIAWHVGANSYKHPYCRNSNGIGIEMCLESDWTISEETLKRTIWLVQKFMSEYEIPIANVLRHYDVTGKSCPGAYLDNGKWEGLKQRFLNDNKVSPPQQDQLYRVRKSWEDANSQIGAYKELDNAKVKCDKHSGYSVFDSKGNNVYPLSSPTPEVPKEEQGTLIIGRSKATAAQMVSYALKGNPKPLLPYCTIEELAQIFIEEGEIENVRADVAWAQALKETGYFKYGGIVLPEQNNYSGLGALNNNAKGDAAIFESPRIGARAQIQHLKAYASIETLKLQCVDPRFHLVKRGSAKYVEWLGYEDNPNSTGWAWPGKGYGYDIIKIMESTLKEPKEIPVEDNIPKWQKDAFDKLVERKIINTPVAWENRLGETITIGEVMGILANMI